MPFDLLVIAASLTLQAANVILALRLILRTRRYFAGGMIIAAVVLMTFRRGISLYRYLNEGELRTDLPAESIALVVSALFFAGIIFATRIIESEVRMRREKEELITGLRAALAEIKTLKGIVPICSSCKKIRDDKGYWNQLELYLSEHSGAEFSHGICPDCAAKLYPQLGFRFDKEDRNP